MFVIPLCKEWFNDDSSFSRQVLCVNVDNVTLMYKTLGLYFIEVGSHKFQLELKEWNNLFDLINESKNSAL